MPHRDTCPGARDSDLYVIWSEEHGRWWARHRMGYTTSLVEAGRYTKGEAEEICRTANHYLPSHARPNEVMIPDPISEAKESPASPAGDDKPAGRMEKP